MEWHGQISSHPLHTTTDDAMKLVQAMGEEGEETMGAWTKEEIVRYTLSMTAIAIQRGNARVMLAGRMQSLKASK